jgi:hypothetical protein
MQKFQKGDLVRIAKDLGPSMSHFTDDCEAIVIGSYADQYPQYDKGERAQQKFMLHLKGLGQSSWYSVGQLTLIESGRLDKLHAWEDEAEAERKQKSDLDWIFANGPEVAEEPHVASIQALAKCFGLTNLWGRNGEGSTYYRNAMGTLEMAAPYLKAGDKAGWLARCELLRANVRIKRARLERCMF